MYLIHSTQNWFSIKLLFLTVILASTITIFGQSAYKTQFINVGGKKMAYKSYGLEIRKAGDPVLVFESGVGGDKGNFDVLFPFLSKTTTGIAYDRNGLGESEADAAIKSDGDVVRRLHDLLKSLRIAPPYLLVGHSLGGAFIRLFISYYPTEVAGLVFIDATDFMQTKNEDDQVKTLSSSATGYRELFVGMMDKFGKDTSIPIGVRGEMKRIGNVNRAYYFNEYTSLKPLPDIPVTVLMEYNRPIEYQEMGLMEEFKINGKAWFQELDRYRIQHFAEMIKNNHNSSMILLPGYSHGIHHQDPELVATAIQDVYKKSIKAQR